MKLFIFTLVAICVGFSEGKTNAQPETYPNVPKKALLNFYDIKDKDLEHCKVADDDIRMENVKYNLKAMADHNAKQPEVKLDVTKQLNFNVIAAALPCLSPSEVDTKVNTFINGFKPPK